MAKRTFDIDADDGVGLVLPGGTHLSGGFTGSFTVNFDYDEPPYVDAIELDVIGRTQRFDVDVRSDLFHQVEASILSNFKNRIDEAWQQECQARSHREEMSDRAYHRYQVL